MTQNVFANLLSPEQSHILANKEKLYLQKKREDRTCYPSHTLRP